MPVGVRRELENIERTIAICERFKKRIAAGDDQATIIADLADDYGVQKPAIWRQVHKGLSPAFGALAQEIINSASEAEDEIEPDDAGMVIAPRTWCTQCEKSVTHPRATACASPFCKAKNASAMSASGQDPEEGLEAKPASAVPKADAQRPPQ